MGYLFSDSGYLSVGDPYEKVGKKKKGESEADPKTWQRHRGKQFTTNPPKKGLKHKGFQSLYKGEKYVDPGRRNRESNKKKREKVLHGPFRPSNPPKKATMVGGYEGTLGKKFEHMADYHVVKRGDKPKSVTQELKNIVTHVPKKGTYGFANLGIGKDYQRGNFVDDYDAAKKNKKKENQIHKDKMKGKAFTAGGSTGKKLFDTNPYRPPQKLPTTTKKKGYENKTQIVKPFVPTSRKDPTIGAHPEYISDPYDKKEKRKKGDEANRPPVWHATRTATLGGPCRSVLFGTRSSKA